MGDNSVYELRFDLNYLQNIKTRYLILDITINSLLIIGLIVVIIIAIKRKEVIKGKAQHKSKVYMKRKHSRLAKLQEDQREMIRMNILEHIINHKNDKQLNYLTDNLNDLNKGEEYAKKILDKNQEFYQILENLEGGVVEKEKEIAVEAQGEEERENKIELKENGAIERPNGAEENLIPNENEVSNTVYNFGMTSNEYENNYNENLESNLLNSNTGQSNLQEMSSSREREKEENNDNNTLIKIKKTNKSLNKSKSKKKTKSKVKKSE